MNPLLSNPTLAVGYMSSQTPLETRFPKPSCDGEYHFFNAAPPSNPNPLPTSWVLAYRGGFVESCWESLVGLSPSIYSSSSPLAGIPI